MARSISNVQDRTFCVTCSKLTRFTRSDHTRRRISIVTVGDVNSSINYKV